MRGKLTEVNLRFRRMQPRCSNCSGSSTMHSVDGHHSRERIPGSHPTFAGVDDLQTPALGLVVQDQVTPAVAMQQDAMQPSAVVVAAAPLSINPCRRAV